KPTRTAAVFAAETDNADARQSITLTADSNRSSAPFVDRETGSHWDIAGRAMSGDLKGQTLRWLPGVQCQWFVWAAEYPETEIHGTKHQQVRPKGSREPSSTKPEGDRAIPDDRQTNVAAPLEGVVVEAADVTPAKVADWSQSGHKAVVVMLDE